MSFLCVPQSGSRPFLCGVNISKMVNAHFVSLSLFSSLTWDQLLFLVLFLNALSETAAIVFREITQHVCGEVFFRPYFLLNIEERYRALLCVCVCACIMWSVHVRVPCVITCEFRARATCQAVFKNSKVCRMKWDVNLTIEQNKNVAQLTVLMLS